MSCSLQFVSQLLHVGNPASKNVVIFGHGLFQKNNHYKSFAEKWVKDIGDDIRFIIPQAPDGNHTFFNAKGIPMWFDFPKGWEQQHSPTPGIDDSMKLWKDCIIANQPPDSKIILAGFSQGGSLAFHTAVFGDVSNLVGIVSSCAYIPLDAWKTMTSFPVPVLITHGTEDQPIPLSCAHFTRDKLKNVGADVELKEYKGEDHDFSEAQAKDIGAFFKKSFKIGGKDEL